MNTICRYLDVSVFQNETRFQYFLNSLPWDERKEKIMSYKFESGKHLSLGASVLLKLTLVDFGIEDFQLVYEDSGRPLLKNKALHFSLSHSGTVAVCAASHHPIGADTEAFRYVNYELLLRRFHPDEIAYINHAEDRELAFFQIWTRKESWGKHNGTGISYDLKEYSFVDAYIDENTCFQELQLDRQIITVCTDGSSPVTFLETAL